MEALNSKRKGSRGERLAIEAICKLLDRKPTYRDRRNSQATAWGGCNNPDIQIQGLEGFHLDIKNTKTFCFPAWKEQLLADCGSKTPVLLYKEQGVNRFWALHRMEDFEDYCVTWLQAKGWRVEK